MMLLAIPSLLVGAVLAQRFRVMILLPATAMMLVLAAVAGLLQSYTVWGIVVLAAAGGASLQIGYLFGLGLHYLLETRSTERPQSARASASARHPPQTTPDLI